MKKIVLFISMLLCCLTTRGFHCFAEEEIYVKAIYSSINVFADSDIYKDFDGDGENLDILKTYTYGQKLVAVGDQFQGADGFYYFPITFDLDGVNVYGYVLSSQILPVELNSPQRVLEPNGEVTKDSKLYWLENSKYLEIDGIIEKGQGIKIIDGYDTSKEYTRVQYKDLDGSILTAYIKTANIKTSGVSSGLIGAIIIIITTVSLVLIVFGIKGRKKKKNKAIK